MVRTLKLYVMKNKTRLKEGLLNKDEISMLYNLIGRGIQSIKKQKKMDTHLPKNFLNDIIVFGNKLKNDILYRDLNIIIKTYNKKID